MKKNKKIKWYYTFGLVFASVLTLAIPFLTLASDFNSNYTFADNNVETFTGSGISFLNYTNSQYRDTLARIYDFRVTTAGDGTTTIHSYLRATTMTGADRLYLYYTSNSSTTSEQFQRETIYGIDHTFTNSSGYVSNQLLGSYNLYMREYKVSSGDYTAVGWGSTGTGLFYQVTYSVGNSGINFGSVVGVRYGAILGSDTQTATQLLRDYNIYMVPSAVQSSNSLFIISLFDENNCCINFIFENRFQNVTTNGGYLWAPWNLPIYTGIRTYYITNTNSSQYIQGFQDGQSSGYASGNLDGYNEGYDIGEQAGYNNGYNEGVLDANQYSFLGLIGAVVDAPIQAFNGLLNFEILGFNMRDFYLGLFSVCIIVLIVRLVLNK